MYYYVINPTAGRGAINNIQDRLRQLLNELGIGGEFVKTTGPGDATTMTRTAIEKGYTTIVAVGGDGTVNEVINGITKDNIAVGIIPIGHSNTLARRLGITHWQQAVTLLTARRLTSFGLIAAGQNYFLSSLSLGFETDLDKRVDTGDSAVTSRLRHFATGWGHAKDFSPLWCQIKVDNKFELECELFSLTVENQKFNNPLAENKLIISIIDKPSRTQLTTYLWKLIKGVKYHEDQVTTRFLANRVLINTKPVTGLMVDGKIAGRTPIAIRLTDRRIRFICEKPVSAFK